MYSVLKTCNIETIESAIKDFEKFQNEFITSKYDLLDHRELKFDEFFIKYTQGLDKINVSLL